MDDIIKLLRPNSITLGTCFIEFENMNSCDGWYKCKHYLVSLPGTHKPCKNALPCILFYLKLCALKLERYFTKENASPVITIQDTTSLITQVIIYELEIFSTWATSVLGKATRVGVGNYKNALILKAPATNSPKFNVLLSLVKISNTF